MNTHVYVPPINVSLWPIPEFSIPTQKGLMFFCNAFNEKEVERAQATLSLQIVQNMYTFGSYLTNPTILLPIQFTAIAIYSYVHFPFTSLFVITKLALYCMELALTTYWTWNGALQKISNNFWEVSQDAATAVAQIPQHHTVVFTPPVEIGQSLASELRDSLPTWGCRIAHKADVALSHTRAFANNFASWLDEETQ